MVNFCDRFVDLCVIDFSVGILILPLPLDVIDFMIVVGGILSQKYHYHNVISFGPCSKNIKIIDKSHEN